MKNFQLLILITLAFLAFIIITLFSEKSNESRLITEFSNENQQSSVCPPFFLLDENGDTINPVAGLNTDKPYSPRQTCGKCHDYELITKGFHFQQGADEIVSGNYAERYQWVSHPGNYGGNWCSPAPLYRYLSAKENEDASLMDMTSFSFITAGCGNCHPGGGSVEYDRHGNLYDKFMIEKGYEPGGINDYDGDYFQARWSETGVLEADCMICHMPGYNNEERLKQLKGLNFRWAPTAGAGFAQVKGSIDGGTPVNLDYNIKLFDADGKFSQNIIREPRNEACLFCHAQPGWKKRGANFSPRSDVHLRAGMKCVDCHPSGSRALDERINKREMHQFAKGDDPGGWVRNDLDNTVINCDHCHSTGYQGAPIAKHSWLPSLHIDRISCQTCHIPERLVKPAQMQAGDVFNPGTRIPTKGKHLWVFYGPDMKYYNHYGNIGMMGYNDKPTDPFKPIFARYKDKIQPVNRIHSAWPAIKVEGEPGLMQPKMGDIYNMWQAHFKDPGNYPELAMIQDDNGDEIVEVNRPEEIDALISAVNSMLQKINYPMEGKQVVWAYNDRVYTSGMEYYTIEKELWEASPFANVHTYNHDVLPARSALGSQGCTECHSLSADMFYAPVVKYPFDESGKPVFEPQYVSLGMGSFQVWTSAVREQFVKSFQVPAVVFLLLLVLLSVSLSVNAARNHFSLTPNLLLLIYAIFIIGLLLTFLLSNIREYVLPERMWFDKNHFWISVFAIFVGWYSWVRMIKTGRGKFPLARLQAIILAIAVVSGLLMLLKLDSLRFITVIAYTLFDVVVSISAIISIAWFINSQLKKIPVKEA